MSIRVQFEFAENDVVECEGYRKLNILAHAQLVERHLNSRCGGHCECGTCRVRVLSGKTSIMKAEEKELLLKMGFSGDSGVRLACQTFPEEASGSDSENLIRVTPV